MKLIYVTQQEDILHLEDSLWDLCQRAYEPIGGFKCLSRKSDIHKRVSLVKLVYDLNTDGEEDLGACALYRDNLGGLKAIAYAGNKGIVPSYRECVQELVKDDIAQYDSWYFVEASDAIEHYFEKHGGYAIPNRYVSSVLQRNIDSTNLSPDGFHYNTTVGLGQDRSVVAKQLFGFPNRDVYDGLIAEYGSLDNFSAHIAELKAGRKPTAEAIKFLDKSIPYDVRTVVNFIENLDECVMQNDLHEVPRKWMDLLDFAIEVINLWRVDWQSVKEVDDAMLIAEDLKSSLSVLTIHKFHAKKPLSHGNF